MGLFSFIGGLFAGGAQKKASQQATDAQVAALNRSIDTQNAFQAQTRQDYAPYTTAGTGAVGQLASLTNGSMTPEQLSATVTGNPLYQSLYNNGQETLLANASATGGLRGGNAERALAGFGSDTMSQVYQQILANLGGVANLGLGAQGNVTQVGQGVTNAVAQGQQGIGTAQATNFLTKGGINAKNWTNAGSFVDKIAGNFAPGGAGLSGALKSIF